MGETLSGVYNPQAIPEAEFLARYSVRLELTEKLLRMILASGPDDEPEHAIIQGQRGQGKTSLLRRIEISLRNNPDTRDWLIPVLFREEHYGVTSLCRLWEETAELLSDRPGFEGLPHAIEAVQDGPHYEKDCYLLLDQALADRSLRLVLFVDNVGDLFGKLKRPEQQRLREILHTTKRIQIIGASTVMLEQHYDHGAPFYQFFREINLPGLSREEALTLLRNLGTKEQQARLEEVLTKAPARVETLRRLTAGVPRTLVLLFEILLDRNGQAFQDLELLLDRVTPLYKHRMDDLPAQQQAIVDAVALGWDAQSSKEIARATRLPSKQVAAQLKQLERANIIHREPTSTKNNLYRLSERFFNIWYLMRHGRRGERRRALWLVRFLEIWCTPNDLRERALGHLTMLTNALLAPEHAWLMTEALRGAGLDLDTEDRLVKATREYLSDEIRDQVGPSIAELIDLTEEAFPPEFLPIFDKERIDSLAGRELREYVKSGMKLVESLAHLETERNATRTLIAEKVVRLDFELDSDWAAMDEIERAITPMDCASYPGLVCFASHWHAESTSFREQIYGLEPKVGKLSSGAQKLLGATGQLLLHSFPKAFEVLESALPQLDLNAESDNITELLSFLLAAEQTAYVRRLFEDEECAVYRFKDRFKPHYFALLAELGESRANDFKRMGPELKETVDEIRAYVRELRQKYFDKPAYGQPTNRTTQEVDFLL